MAHMENSTPSTSITPTVPPPPSLSSLSLQPPSSAPAPTAAPQSPNPYAYSPPAPQYAPPPTQQQYAPPPQPTQNFYNNPPPSQPQSYYPAPAPVVNNPGASRAPPLNNADPRVKDAVELCNFAISAIKVSTTFSHYFLFVNCRKLLFFILLSTMSCN